MKTFVFLILLLVSFSCGKENGKQKAPKKEMPLEKDSKCFSEEKRAKDDIENGSLKYFIGASSSSNYNKMLEVKEVLKKKNIEVDFVGSTCIPLKGIQNCYEDYMNSEFVKTKGKSTVDTIIKAFEKVNIKIFKVKKCNSETELRGKRDYNSSL